MIRIVHGDSVSEFNLDKSGILAARELLIALASSRKLSIKIDGHVLSHPKHALSVMSCYAKSTLLKDPRPYCWRIYNRDRRVVFIDSKGKSGEDKQSDSIPLSPCQFIGSITGGKVISPRDRMIAEAARKEVWWCPHLRIDEFAKLISDCDR